MIYFDNAATTRDKPEEVIEAVVNAMRKMGNASRGVYDESLSADRILYNVRLKLAKLFNGESPKQVAFTKNSTEALNIALFGLIYEKDHVISSEMEHNSVLRPLNYLKRDRNVSVDYLKLDQKGRLILDDFERLIKDNTKALILSHASNVTGNINDLKLIGKICKDKGILFIVDGSQSAGSIEIDMKDMNIDVLCFTGHKSLLGPQGTGGLCIKKDIHIKPLMSGGTGVQTYNEFQPLEMPTLLEAGTLNAHGIAGLGAGIDYINREGMSKLTARAQEMSKLFYNGIKDLDGLKFYGDYSNFSKRSAIISININDLDSSQVSMILSEKYNISTRPGAHCVPLLHKAFNTVNQGMVRFSFSHQNTEEEVEIGVNSIKEILKGGRY